MSNLGADLVEADVRLYRGRLEVRHLRTVGPLPILWDRWQLAAPRRRRLQLAELDGEVVGFALYLSDYSTFAGRSGIFLEDLFVTAPARGRGIGRSLLARLAAIARERGATSLNLMVLDWNPAREFYHRLGCAPVAGWLPYQVSGAALYRLAEEDR